MDDTRVATTRLGFDPECPDGQAAAAHPLLITHTCRRRDGRLVRPGVDDCWTKARREAYGGALNVLDGWDDELLDRARRAERDSDEAAWRDLLAGRVS